MNPNEWKTWESHVTNFAGLALPPWVTMVGQEYQETVKDIQVIYNISRLVTDVEPIFVIHSNDLAILSKFAVVMTYPENVRTGTYDAAILFISGKIVYRSVGYPLENFPYQAYIQALEALD